MRKAARADAQSFLTDVASRQQQYLVDKRRYATSVATLNMAPSSQLKAKFEDPIVGRRAERRAADVQDHGAGDRRPGVRQMPDADARQRGQPRACRLLVTVAMRATATCIALDPRGELRGFTAVEALTVLAVIAMLAAIALPSLANVLASQRLRAAGTDLMSSLLLARSEAIKRNAQVEVAPANCR